MAEDIMLTVGMDPQDAIDKANDLQKAIKDIFDQTAGKRFGDKFDKQLNNIKKQINSTALHMEKLKRAMSSEGSKQLGYTPEYQKELDIIKNLRIELKKYKKEATDPNLVNWQRNTAKGDVRRTKAKIRYREGKLQNLEANNQKYIYGTSTEKYKELGEQLGQDINKMNMLVSAARGLTAEADKTNDKAEESSSAWDKFRERMDNIKANASKIISTFKKIATPIANGVKALGKMGARLLGINKASDKHNLSLKRILKQTLKWGLGIRSVFILWRKLRAYTQDALKLMATQFTEVDADVSMLMNSFNAMKLSMGTMVQPLMHALAPALVYIIDLISAAATALANFFAIITGQSYIYKAKKADDSYADSIKGVGSAAKEANKELAEYDNLLVIDQPKDSGGGGSGAADGLTGEFEKVAAESDLAKIIKEAIAKGDWEGVGSAFADRLNVITDRFDTWINTKFRPAGEKWAVRIARILNGFTDRVNGKKMGKTLADAFNSAFSIVNKFLTNYDFKKLGIRIADFGSGFVQNIDPTLIGQTFANKINAGLKLISGLITFDWRTLGSKIGTNISAFFRTTDWQLAGEDFSGLAHGILTTLGTAIEVADFDAVGDAFVNFLNGINFEEIANDLSKLATNILDALGKVNWVDVGNAVGHAIGTFLNGIDFVKVGVSLIELAGKILAGIASAMLKLITDAPLQVAFGTAIIGLIKSAKMEKTALQSAVGTAMNNATGGGALSIGTPFKVLIGISLGLKVGELGAKFYAWICEQLGLKQYANEVRYFLKDPIKVIASITELDVPAADRLTATVADKMKAVIEEALSKGFSVDEIKALIGYDELDEATAQLVDRIFLDIKAGNAKIKEDVQETGTNVERSLGTAGVNITDKVNQTVSDVKKAWDKQDLSNHFTDVANGIEDSFDNVPKNLTDTFTTAKTDVENVWNQNDVSDYFTARSTDVNNAFSQLPSELGGTFSDTLSQVKTSFAEDSLTNHFTSVKDNIEGAFTELPTFFGTTFEDSWNTVQEAFSNGSTVFGEFNTGISESMTTTVNGLITGLNSVVSKPFQAINDALSRLRNLKFGASSVFSSLPIFSNIPSIPKLAQGAVIPPNREFLAMLGDQSSGTNIETPLATMVDAFKTALADMNISSNNAPVVLQLNSKVVAQAVWDEEDKKYKQTGRR